MGYNITLNRRHNNYKFVTYFYVCFHIEYRFLSFGKMKFLRSSV